MKGKTVHLSEEVWRRLMKLKYDMGARSAEEVVAAALAALEQARAARGSGGGNGKKIEVSEGQKVGVPEGRAIKVSEEQMIKVPEERKVEVPEERKIEVQEEQKVEVPKGKAAPPVERRETGEEVPPKAEAPSPAGRLGRPDLLTAGQLDFIKALLERNRWSWLDVKDVLEFDTGLVLPDDPSQLTKEAASRVIDALRSWERKPSSEELRKARQIMAQLPKEVLERLNLPERASDAKRYHVVLLERAWARWELERARRGGGK